MITKTTYSVPFGTTSFNTTIFKQFALLLVFGLLNLVSNAQTVIILDQPGTGTFVVPCGINKIDIEVWGSGGAGGGSSISGGGGYAGLAGYYSIAQDINVVAGGDLDYSIAKGATGNISGSNHGGQSFIQLQFGSWTWVGANGNNGGDIANNSTDVAQNGVNAINDKDGNIIGTGGQANHAGDGFPGGPAAGGGGGTMVNGVPAKGGDGGDGMIRITMYGDTENTQYCKTTYSQVVEPITQITFAGIDNTSSATVNGSLENELFCNEVGTVVRGSDDNEIIIRGNTNGNKKNYFVAYIDWNQDGIFGDDEYEEQKLGELKNSTGAPDSEALVKNIKVPSDAKLGTTTMRIIKTGNNDGSATDACKEYKRGQAEDYTLVVKEFEDEDDEDDDSCTDIVYDCEPTFDEVVPITQVTFAGIDNSSDSSSNDELERFCDVTGTVTRGSSYSMTLGGETNGKDVYFVAFIDWDQDGEFEETNYDDDNERQKITNFSSNESSGTGTLVVPADAQLGTTTIRIIKRNGGSPNNPCDNYDEGQAEEYTLIVEDYDGSDCDPFTSTCYPEYDNVSPITRVKFSNIDNYSSSSSNEAVERFCNVTGNLVAGDTYTISLEGVLDGDKNFFVAYIDLDGDGEYNSLQNDGNNGGEEFKLVELEDDDDTVTAEIAIPLNAKPGLTSIRIVKTGEDDGSSTWACFNEIQDEEVTYNNGQIEEYPLFIERECITWEPGTGNNKWDNQNNWNPKTVPDQHDCVIIPSLDEDQYPILDNNNNNNNNDNKDAKAYSVYIEAGASLTLESNSTLTVEDDLSINGELSVSGQGILTVNNILTVAGNLNASDQSIITVDDLLTLRGNITLNDDASFIQTNETDRNVSTGTFTVNRTPETARSTDYVYWSSPVEKFNIDGISTTSHRYEWLPTVGNKYGNWSKVSNINMTPGKGYIIRGHNYTASFQDSKPNNGTINASITRGTYDGDDYNDNSSTQISKEDDNWNLIGNPYPSAISADDFITKNSGSLDPGGSVSGGTIEGGVRIWTHANELSSDYDDPFYASEGSSYNTDDYIAYTLSGSSPSGFDGYIASGQGFFVLMKPSANQSKSNATFTNDMRSFSSEYKNDAFYRSNDQKNRVWLNLIDSKETATEMLLGYFDGAVNAKDPLYDAIIMDNSAMSLYSLIDDEAMVIQGRRNPIQQDDIIPLGFISTKKDQYSIGISKVDGVFESENQNIYLEDLYTNTTHDLRKSAYSFTSEAGTFNNRFVLRYQAKTLSVDDVITNNTFKIIATQEFIKVSTGTSTINTIVVYDVLGRVLYQVNTLNASEVKLDQFKPTNSPLIVRATLSNGKEKTQKVIY
ncbi:hypothetical protein BN863_28210 [Formosa agariphila KMM 3901]|uniref:GEVED domain-containing protein n=1 Tax=Formosa agariphila (strain DSM 15362 / KCTC 12365 / LMG 23005 / KMM 3901 / M-2Alg 35-1) TaxID=1347342 RepID=T2KPV5_FORAG|nr:GEVED domain-containing protein [Formosa agariphila]CDF80533.1 hypothetical protein BN863_28210 [Formosa agariphila KMM 3901]